MRRGDIYWAELPSPWGHRPIAIISRDQAVTLRSAISVATVTSRIRDLDSEVFLNEEDGMEKTCVINCDNLITIPKSRLRNYITHLRPEKYIALDNALRFALDLEEPH